MKKKKGKGNIKRQRERRRSRRKYRNKDDYYNDEFELIDGNYTHYPVGFCDHYERFLSAGLVQTHRCKKRKSKKLLSLEQIEQKLNTKFR